MTARRVIIQYCPVPSELDRYVSALFYCEIELQPGDRLQDVLCPDWASFRFHFDSLTEVSMRNGSTITGSRFTVSGPRSQEVHFSMGSARQWGFRLRPLGWVALTGQAADAYANVIVDGDRDPNFERFRPLYDALQAEQGALGAQLDRIVAFLSALEPRPVPHEDLIVAIGEALADPELRSSVDLVKRVGANSRMVERVCRAAFGFPPKLLLRRQRFLRSVEQFTLDPTLKWIGAIDAAYHDQAQFVRDFRAFMGMSPRQYAQLDKPLTVTLIRERIRQARTAGR
ncbi:AraC family transcriptional regulator [Novosphingobium sp. PhB165]|uniref:helix-turn-helix domain-containing protein n=1 Tax=Novosphingobium sp. PhB165 TaxID=2485105 RepID=UPI0010E22D1E|nr:helix-turn-helix domain-containing protein [Novosphingobium sp. PhB165]TCM18742.1 AraC family transcriptional regulator [Novosphingobium sp. PhB165]